MKKTPWNTTRRKALTAAGAALALGLWAGSAAAQTAEPLKAGRIGVATGGVGSDPVRHGGTSAALAYTDGALEEEFKKDGVKVQWTFFKGAGPAVNEALVEQPELVNHDPFGKGWLFKLKPDHKADLEDLLDADAYETELPEEEE